MFLRIALLHTVAPALLAASFLGAAQAGTPAVIPPDSGKPACQPIVLLVHGNRLRSALREHNPDVEWIAYDAEDHDWSLPANQADFWTKVERFLDRNIGAAAKP